MMMFFSFFVSAFRMIAGSERSFSVPSFPSQHKMNKRDKAGNKSINTNKGKLTASGSDEHGWSQAYQKEI